jgi:hypothetical protein
MVADVVGDSHDSLTVAHDCLGEGVDLAGEATLDGICPKPGLDLARMLTALGALVRQAKVARMKPSTAFS